MSKHWQEQATTNHTPDYLRCTFRHGPIDIVAKLDGPQREKQFAYEQGKSSFQSILIELCQELALLRTPISQCPASPQGKTAQSMFLAANRFSASPHLTPMAAVAGAVADTLLQSMVKNTTLARCCINNGGDIALHLASEQTFRAGICFDPKHCHISDTAKIHANDRIGGIATSGWRGRSHSLGIADSVTVFAASAAMADVAATLIANAVDLPHSSKITRTPANQLAPDSDLGNLPVTTNVAQLTDVECKAALEAAWTLANQFVEQGKVRAVHATLQGHRLTVSANDLNRTDQLAIMAQQAPNQTGTHPYAQS